MKKITSRMTYFHRRLFPLFWFGINGIVLAGGLIATFKGGQHLPPPFLFIPVVMMVFGYFLMKMLLFDLMDEVYDCDDHLLVRSGKIEDKIYLKSVMNISYSQFTNPRRITLHLRVPSRLGKQISFEPPLRMFEWGVSPLVQELIERVDRARGGQ